MNYRIPYVLNVLILLFSICFNSLSALAEVREVRIGVLAFRGTEQTLRLWQPTADYLSNTVRGYRFVIVPLDHPGMKRALARHRLDFVLTNTGHYVELEAVYGITRIATLVNRHGNLGLDRFGAVIFTRADRKDLNTLRNLHGKTFVAVKPHAFGGFRMAWAELLKHGVDPFADLKELKFAGFPVDKVAYAVLNREADAGTFRTGVLERLHKAGKIDIKDFKILGRRQTKGFPLLHSTELYPEWPFARTNQAPAKITEKIIIALLKLDQDSPPSRLAGIKGWTVPLDYMKVHELYKTLKVGPYEGLGRISVHALVEQYWHIGIMTLLLLVVLTATSLYIWKLDKKVRKSEYCLARAQEIAHIGSWEWDVDRNEMSWSEEVFHILGMEKQARSFSIEDFLERVPEPDADQVRAAINDTLYRNKTFNIDHKIMLDDGTVRIVHEQAEVRRDESGRVRHMSGIIQDITARKTAEDMIRDSRQELATILDNMQDTFFRINSYGRIISVSPSVQQLLGYSTEEIIGTRFINYLACPGNRALFYAELRERDGRVDNFEIELRDKDGMDLSVAISAHLLFDDQGDLIGLEGVARNITELVNAREDLSKEKERIQTTLESIGDGVITTDVTGVVEYMNAVADKITGWQLAEARGMPLFQVFDVKAPRAGKSLECCLQKTLSDDNDTTCAIHNAVLVSKSGERFFVEITMAPIRDHGSQTIGSVIVFHDITEAREMAKKMAYQARHDALTGLVNRQEFEEQLEHLLHSNPEHKSHAVLIIEINNFAEIEENCGRAGRDDLLRQVANQLKAQVRDVDALARIGGAEFGLLLRNCPQDRARSIGQSLLTIGEGLQYTHEGRVFDVGLNIGVASFDGSSLTVDDVLNAGELACIKAKSFGNNTLHVSAQDEDIEEQRMRERAWKARIRKALEESRLSLYYQPVFPVSGTEPQNRPPQYEVLVRMRDEQGNIILPLAFMAAAERYRLVGEIDQWVFLRVLEVLETGKQFPENSVFSINVSAHSVYGEKYQELVASRLKQSHVMPGRIRFEIRESVALGNYVDTLSFINFLSNIGCQFVLDNFGIGPSSFSYLQNIPVEFVKIDGSLIRNIASSEVDYAIVEALNLVVHSMGKTCIAKSVENDAIKHCLEKIGVDYMQGFGVEKPLPFFPGDSAMSETA